MVVTNADLALVLPVLIMVFLFVVTIMLLKHRETMAMIEKGLVTRKVEDDDQESREAALRGGLITSAVGLALLLGLWTIGVGPWLLGGLIPLFIGFARIIGAFFASKNPRGNS